MSDKVSNLVQEIEASIPLSMQESYDNSGLLIGDPDSIISNVLICIDFTREIIDEALRRDCNVVICHHPPIFNAIKSIVGDDNDLLIRSIRKKLNIYALHTGFDRYRFGTSLGLAKQFKLDQITLLQQAIGSFKKLIVYVPEDHAAILRETLFACGAGHIGNYDSCSFSTSGIGTFKPRQNTNPYIGEADVLHSGPELRIETVFPSNLQKQIVDAMLKAHPYEEVAYDIFPVENNLTMFGYGAVGNLEKSLSAMDFLKFIKTEASLPFLKHSAFSKNKIVDKVAVAGGSGAFLIDEAIMLGVDAFITADLKYHDFQKASDKLLLIDIGHYESEVYAKELIKEFLSEKFPNFAFLISGTDTNFVRYL